MEGDQFRDGGRPDLPLEAAAREVPVPTPFSVEEFSASLEAWYGCPLALVAAPLREGCPAAWVCTIYGDFILYNRSLPLTAQVRAIAHQLAHMLLNHRGDVDTACDRFTADEEREADTFAGALLSRMNLTE